MLSNFLLINDLRVQELRQSDSVVAAIAGAKGSINFRWLREGFKRDHDIKNSLKWGTAILGSHAQLDQYLFTYGNMIQAQWNKLLANIQLNNDPIRIIDYGCGQGLAGLVIADYLGKSFRSTVSEVILIEPSELALVRAEAVYRNLFPKARIDCVSSLLEDIDPSLFTPTSNATVHIFSNLLDVQGVDPRKVFGGTLCTGDHAIFAVSPRRDFDGGNAQFVKLKREFDEPEHVSWLTVHSSKITEFNCGVGGKFPAISWAAHLSVDHG